MEINRNVQQMSSFLVMDVLEKANAMQAQGMDVIHLEVGEPDFDIPEVVQTAVATAYREHHTHYTHSLGLPALRQAIAGLYQREYGVQVSPNNIVVCPGSSPAILLLTTLLCNPGDEVILSNPGYACYGNFVLAAGGKPVYVPLLPEEGFRWSLDRVKAAMTERTKAIVINSPMNPIGYVLEEETLRQLAGLGIPVVSDEIYHGLSYEGQAHSILEYTDQAFVLNGFSKRYAMTGLRLGYLIAPSPYMRDLQTLQQNFLICAPSTAQYAGIAALEQAQGDVQRMCAEYDCRRRYMLERLQQMRVPVPAMPQGAFYIFCDMRQYTSNSLHFAFDMLEKARVGVTPGVDFGSAGEGFIRLSYANSLENLQEGMNRMEHYLQAL